MHLKSQTWNELKLLLQELPSKRLRYLILVLLASLVQGLIDILLIGLLARLVGLLAGAKLGDQIPGIRFFGGGLLDQSGWIGLDYVGICRIRPNSIFKVQTDLN